MNKTKIDWADMTWSPVTGCLHGCGYCYARKIAKRFGGGGYGREMGMFISKYKDDVFKPPYVLDEPQLVRTKDDWYRVAPYPFGFAPTFHKYRLNEPQQVKKPQRIFVVSMGDLFGEWVPDSWIETVFMACENAPQHQYLFLTKNPKRYGQINGWNHRYDWSIAKDNWWFGMTVTGNGDIEKLRHLPYGHTNTFVSFEPLSGWVDLDPYLPKPTTRWKCSRCGHLADNYSLHCQHCNQEGGYSGSFRKHPINWVIIGAETGPGAKPPQDEWVQNIIDRCKATGTAVFVKSPLYEKFPIQEWPEGLRKEMEK
jgi:protein gp37